jgi:DNA-binding beta-propeller fold protein YncE
MMIANNRLVWSLLSLGLLAGLAGRAGAEILYGADGQNGNPATNLYVLDPGTGGVIRTVGPIGFAVTGMSFSPATGVLYGVTAPKGNGRRELITINPNTGAGTLVGPLGVSMDDVAFARDGTLYGWSGRISGSSLYRIDLATGAATKVGNSGITDVGVGFSISPSGTPFLAAAGASGVLRTVDLMTGAVTPVATLSGAPFPTGSIDAFAFDAAGTLLGVNLSEGGPGHPGAPGNAFLISVDPTTGVITPLGPTVPGLDALAVGPSIFVPEPSTLALLALGCGGLAAWRRWKKWARASASG